VRDDYDIEKIQRFLSYSDRSTPLDLFFGGGIFFARKKCRHTVEKFRNGKFTKSVPVTFAINCDHLRGTTTQGDEMNNRNVFSLFKDYISTVFLLYSDYTYRETFALNSIFNCSRKNGTSPPLFFVSAIRSSILKTPLYAT